VESCSHHYGAMRSFGREIRIGIDGRRLGSQPKGIGRYIWELCNGLDEVLPNARFFLYTPRSLNVPQISNRWSFRVDESPFRRLPSNLWLVVGAGRLAQRDEVDCFWSGSGLLPLVGVRARTVLTIHDLVHKVAPETMDTRALWATRLFFRLSVANANALVTNSEGTARRLEKYFGYKAAAIVRPGLSQLFQLKSECEIQQILANYKVSKPYLLAVATWEPRKGLELLIKTFLNMKAVGLVRDHKLVLIGERGWKYTAIADLARRNSDAILSLGFVDDVALSGLYRGAEAFVFPSKYEGFGMPVLEAMAARVPVACSRIPPLVEVAGEWASYFDPSDEGEIQTALERLAENSEAPDGARERTKEFTWEKAARETLGVMTVFQLPRT